MLAGRMPKVGWKIGSVKHAFADSLHGVHLGAILHSVDGEVDLRQRLLLLYCANGIVDLDVADVLRARRASAVGFHDGRRGAGDREGVKGREDDETRWQGESKQGDAKEDEDGLEESAGLCCAVLGCC